MTRIIETTDPSFSKYLQKYVFVDEDGNEVVLTIMDLQFSGWPIDGDTGEDLEILGILETER